MSFSEILPFAAALGLIPAFIAYRKGNPFISNWFVGTLLFVVALPIAIFAPPNLKVLAAREEKRAAQRGEVRCVACREFIRRDASICPHCKTAQSVTR